MNTQINRRHFLPTRATAAAVVGPAAIVVPAFGQPGQTPSGQVKAQTAIPRWLGMAALFLSGLGLLAPAAEAGGQDAFVRVSPRDPRYFELSDGSPYIPIGFNFVSAPDMREVEQVVDLMAANRINYCRIWLDQNPWGVENTRSGQYDGERAKNLDRFLALCRPRGIRVKMCLEFFRNITPQRTIWSDKPLHHVDNGGPFRDMDDFLKSEPGRAQFKKKLAWYAQRYGNEPAVFAWELWNEMNAVRGDWRPWTREMLPELHRLFPKNLCVQSLGSFDSDGSSSAYRELVTIKDNDVAQVHRYLDPGAQLEICHGPVDLLAADAVKELQAVNPGKPIILTETGAVKPRHTGVSELYAKDPQGTLLHDMLFTPFFSGAAGTGHVWWWREAIERPKLWWHYARFAKAVEGIDPAGEGFVPVQTIVGRVRVYALKGKRTYLAWCRDRENTWQNELVDGKQPEVISGTSLDLAACGLDLTQAKARVYDPWGDKWSEAKAAGGRVALGDFTRSVLLRVEGQ